MQDNDMSIFIALALAAVVIGIVVATAAVTWAFLLTSP